MIRKQFRIGVFGICWKSCLRGTPQGERSVSEDSALSIRCKCNISQRKPTPTSLRNMIGFHWMLTFFTLPDHWHWQSMTRWRRRSADLQTGDRLIYLRIGFVKAIQSVLRIREGGLIHAGPPCSSWIWMNRGTSKRSLGNLEGDRSEPSVVTMKELLA